MPTEPLKQVTPIAPAPINPPDLSGHFTLEGFDVDQLPSHGEVKEAVSTDKVVEGEVPINTDANDKTDKTKTTSTEVLPKTEAESGTLDADASLKVESKDKGDGLPKFLKPPKGKEGEAAPTNVIPLKTAEVKPIVPKLGARGFTGFSKEESDAGRQMSNEAFAIYKKAITTRNELTSLKEQTIMQHPQAYVLDPGFQQAQTDLSYARKEADYWEQQLVNMDAGKEFVPISGFNPQTGEPILGQAMPATKAIEERVRMMVHNCYNAAQQLQGKLQEYPAKYQANVKSDLETIHNYRKQQFGWVNDERLLDYSVNVDGLGERTLKQIGEDVKRIIPSYMHSHPLSNVVSDLVISLRLKQAELTEALANQQVQQVKASEQDLVEPSSKARAILKSKNSKFGDDDKFVIDPSLGI